MASASLMYPRKASSHMLQVAHSQLALVAMAASPINVQQQKVYFGGRSGKRHHNRSSDSRPEDSAMSIEMFPVPPVLTETPCGRDFSHGAVNE